MERGGASRKGIVRTPGEPVESVPSPRFKLSLLGRFELTGPQGVVELPSKKLAALLATLRKATTGVGAPS